MSASLRCGTICGGAKAGFNFEVQSVALLKLSCGGYVGSSDFQGFLVTVKQLRGPTMLASPTWFMVLGVQRILTVKKPVHFLFPS